jgi:SEC-C motif-containing protein
MRARYSAHVLGDADFLLRSWHPDTRPPDLTLDGSLTWTGLTVVDVDGGDGLQTAGVVEFVARYVSGGVEHQLHERSTFERVAGKWLYVDGHRPSGRPPVGTA